MARVLLTQGELKQTLGITRELGINKHYVGVLSLGRHSMHGIAVASFSKYCKAHHSVTTYLNEDEFIEELIIILQKGKYDFVIPVGAPFVEWLTRNRNRIELYAKVPFPDEEIVKSYEDKKFTASVAKELGVPVPYTIYPKSITDLKEISSSINYPVVIKANKEIGGNIVDYASNANELIAKYSIIIEKHNLENDLPMLQEYLTGSGAGFFALYNNGVCIQSFQHKRIREYPVSGGASCCAVSISDEKIAVYGKRILDNAKWDGVAMVEFKYNSLNTPCFLEVNPKFWGSYDLSVACGVNFAHKLLCSQRGIKVNENEAYKQGIVYSWPYNGDLRHCFERGGVFRLWKGVVFGNIQTNLSWKDWRGSFAIRANWVLEMAYILYKKIKAIFR